MARPSGSPGTGGLRDYALILPADLQTDQLLEWVRSITAAAPLTFELIASDDGLCHRLRAHEADAEHLVTRLRTLVPGTHVAPDGRQLPTNWTETVELGLAHRQRMLHIPSPDALSASLLAAAQTTASSEIVVVQWIVKPVRPAAPPVRQQRRGRSDDMDWRGLFGLRPAEDLTAERQSKFSEPNYLAVLRVGVRSSDRHRASHLMAGIRAVYASTATTGNRFERVMSGDAGRRIAGAVPPRTFPAALSASELTAVIGWPLGSPHVAGLPQGRTRNLATPRSVPAVGRVLAISTFPGDERPIALAYADAPKHLHVLGPIGTGKTTALINYAVQDVSAGHGLTLIDPKGDLFHGVLDRIPRERATDVIVMDVKVDTAHPVAFNVLDQGDVRVAAESIASLFEHLYPDMRRGVRARAALHRGLHALSTQPDPNLIDLVPLFSNLSRTQPESEWRDQVIAGVTDYEGQSFWQRFENMRPSEQDMWTAPILDRLWQLTERPEIKNVIGQSKSSFTMGDVLHHRRILLVNLAGLGRETASITGTLIINALWDAARTGAAAPSRPHSLFLDEFADFVQLPVSLNELLIKSRSFGLSMVLAHQDLAQLPLDMRSAILANGRSKIVFQTTADDARLMAREFGPLVNDTDFLNLRQFEVLGRVATSDGVSSPVTGVTLPARRPTGLAGRIRANSRQRYGRPLAQVQQDIVQRRTSRNLGDPGSSDNTGGSAPRRPRPTIGGGRLTP